MQTRTQIVSLDAEIEKLMEKLRSPDAETRNSAAPIAGRMGAAAIAPLADLMAGADKGAARAATLAMQHIAHYSARPGAPAIGRRRVASELLKIASSTRPRMVRSEALETVGFIGDAQSVPVLALLLGDAAVREDARMALERIPGPQSYNALQQALRQAPADFAPALRQSLHNRSLSRATVGARPMGAQAGR